MTTSVGHFTEAMVEVASTQLYMLKGGTGEASHRPAWR